MRDFRGEVNLEKSDLPVEANGDDVERAFALMLCVVRAKSWIVSAKYSGILVVTRRVFYWRLNTDRF